MTSAVSSPQRVVAVFCGARLGSHPEYKSVARELAHCFHAANIRLVYGGGTTGIMGIIAKELVRLSGPSAVHGIIPRALVSVASGSSEESAQQQQLQAAEDGDEEEEELRERLRKEHLQEQDGDRNRDQDQAPPAGGDGGDGGGPPAAKTNGDAEDAGGGKQIERTVEWSDESYGRVTVVDNMHVRKHMMAREVVNGARGSGFVVLPGGFGTLEEAMEITTWNQLGIHECGIIFVNVQGYWDLLLQWREKAIEAGFLSEPNKHIVVECKQPSEVVDALMNYRLSEGRMTLDWGAL